MYNVIFILIFSLEAVFSSIVTSYTGCTEADDYSPDPSDCRKFFRCSNGFLYSFTCAPGTAFDPVIKACNFIELVSNCDPEKCSIENDYTQDFKNCKNFYRCLNNELVSFSCPLDTIFDATLKLCVCSYPGSECTTSSTDNPMPSTISAKKCTQIDDYSPDPTDCHKFFRCANGILYSYTCAPGTAFDPIMKLCIFEDQVSACKNLIINEYNSEKRCTQADDYSPDPSDCRKFFRCSNGQLFSFICADGTAFDSTLKICNHAYLVSSCNLTSQTSTSINTITCTDNDSFKPYLNNCQKYYYCDNGTLITQTCPVGHVFDSDLKICFCSETLFGTSCLEKSATSMKRFNYLLFLLLIIIKTFV